MATFEVNQGTEVERPLTRRQTILVSTCDQSTLHGFHIFQKLNLQKITMWAGKLEVAQSTTFAMIWVTITMILLFKYDDWKKDVMHDTWLIENIPLVPLVFTRGCYFTIFLCLAIGFMHMGLGFIGSTLLTAAEVKRYEDIRVWLRLSCFISLIQFLQKLILALCNMDGPYLSAFLWIQILFRMASIGIANNYYDILLLIKDSSHATSLESKTDEEEAYV